MLKVQNIKKRFGGAAVLYSASLTLEAGSAVCIAGKNASGKTTLLKIICGLLSPDGGTVEINGRVAFVPQQPAVLPELSVSDNLRLWYSAQNKSGPSFSPASIEVRLGLEPFRKKKVKALSGGMQKRLSIASALVSAPDLLLLDEPFAALDAAGCRELEQLLCSLKASKVGILFTSHEPDHISAVADRLLILRGGSLYPACSPLEMSREQLARHILSQLYPVSG